MTGPVLASQAHKLTKGRDQNGDKTISKLSMVPRRLKGNEVKCQGIKVFFLYYTHR